MADAREMTRFAQQTQRPPAQIHRLRNGIQHLASNTLSHSDTASARPSQSPADKLWHQIASSSSKEASSTSTAAGGSSQFGRSARGGRPRRMGPSPPGCWRSNRRPPSRGPRSACPRKSRCPLPRCPPGGPPRKSPVPRSRGPRPSRRPAPSRFPGLRSRIPRSPRGGPAFDPLSRCIMTSSLSNLCSIRCRSWCIATICRGGPPAE